MTTAAISPSGNSEQYFGRVRKEIEPYLPKHATRALEVGCGQGGTLDWLKQTGRVGKAFGVEYSEDAAKIAATRLDGVVCGDAEQLQEPFGGEFDLILCLDVLEHLRDPWTCLRNLCEQLAEGGTLIVTLPNVRHHGVVMPLLFEGKFEYRDAGTLDRTHLRFFTRKSAAELVSQAGIAVTEVVGQGWEWTDSKFWKRLGRLSIAPDLCNVQLLVYGTKTVSNKKRAS